MLLKDAEFDKEKVYSNVKNHLNIEKDGELNH